LRDIIIIIIIIIIIVTIITIVIITIISSSFTFRSDMFVMIWKSGPSLERGLLAAWWRSWLELYGTIVKLRFRSNWPRLKVSL